MAKEYMVEIYGTFRAIGYYTADSMKGARDMALTDLHEGEGSLGRLALDYEQQEIEVIERAD